jgi:hypothetical protein
MRLKQVYKWVPNVHNFENQLICFINKNLGEQNYYKKVVRYYRQFWRISDDFPPKAIWGRCYDHNFLRFSTIYGEKIGVFLKYQCYDQFFSKFSFVLSQKRRFFRKIFRRKYLKNHNIGPWSHWPCP